MPHRYMCSSLEEMREALKASDIKAEYPVLARHLSGLIEEIQTMGNRMEDRLKEYKDMGRDLDKRKELEEEIEKLEKRKEKLTGKKIVKEFRPSWRD